MQQPMRKPYNSTDQSQASKLHARQSLQGLEPCSPAAASADRLSVTFAMEHDVIVTEDDVLVREELEQNPDPISVILGSLKRTISVTSGQRRGSGSSEHKTYVSFDSPEPDIAPPEIPEDAFENDDDIDATEQNNEYDVGDDDEYSSGIREILEISNLDARRRSSGASRSRRLSTISGMLKTTSRPTSRHSEVGISFEPLSRLLIGQLSPFLCADWLKIGSALFIDY